MRWSLRPEMSICQHFVFLETESAIFVETLSSCCILQLRLWQQYSNIPWLWRPYGRIACQEVYEWQILEGRLCYIWDRSRLQPQTDRDGGSVRRIDEERIVLLTPDWLKYLNTYVWQTFWFVHDASSSCFCRYSATPSTRVRLVYGSPATAAALFSHMSVYM